MKITFKYIISLYLLVVVIGLMGCSKSLQIDFAELPSPEFNYFYRFTGDTQWTPVTGIQNTVKIKTGKNESIDFILVNDPSRETYQLSNSEPFSESKVVQGSCLVSIDLTHEAVYKKPIALTYSERYKQVQVNIENPTEQEYSLYLNNSFYRDIKNGEKIALRYRPNEEYTFSIQNNRYADKNYISYRQVPNNVKINKRQDVSVNFIIEMFDIYNQPVKDIPVIIREAKQIIGSTSITGNINVTTTLNYSSEYTIGIEAENYFFNDTSFAFTENVPIELRMILKPIVKIVPKVVNRLDNTPVNLARIIINNETYNTNSQGTCEPIVHTVKRVNEQLNIHVEKQHWSTENAVITFSANRFLYSEVMRLTEDNHFIIELVDQRTREPLPNIKVNDENVEMVTNNAGKAKIYTNNRNNVQLRFHSNDGIFEDFERPFSNFQNRETRRLEIPTISHIRFTFVDQNGAAVNNVNFTIDNQEHVTGNSNIKVVFQEFTTDNFSIKVDKDYYKTYEGEHAIAGNVQITLEKLYITFICQSGDRYLKDINVQVDDNANVTGVTNIDGVVKVPVPELDREYQFKFSDPSIEYDRAEKTLFLNQNMMSENISFRALPLILVSIIGPDARPASEVEVFINGINKGKSDSEGKLRIVSDYNISNVAFEIRDERYQPIRKEHNIDNYPYQIEISLPSLAGFFYARNAVTGEVIENFSIQINNRTKNSIPAVQRVAWVVDKIPINLSFTATSANMEPLTGTCQFNSRIADSNSVNLEFYPRRREVNIRFEDQFEGILPRAQINNATLFAQMTTDFKSGNASAGVVTLNLLPYKYVLNYTAVLGGNVIQDIDTIDVAQISESGSVSKIITILNLARCTFTTDPGVRIRVTSIGGAQIGDVSTDIWEKQLQRGQTVKIELERDGNRQSKDNVLISGNSVTRYFRWTDDPLYEMLRRQLDNRHFSAANQILQLEYDNNPEAIENRNWYSEISYELGNGLGSIPVPDSARSSALWLARAALARDTRITRLADIQRIYRGASNYGLGREATMIFEKLYSMITQISPANQGRYIDGLLDDLVTGYINNLTRLSVAPEVDRLRYLYCPKSQQISISEIEYWERGLQNHYQLYTGSGSFHSRRAIFNSKVNTLRIDNPRPTTGSLPCR
ncbi:MAG: hypothetical protein JXB49_01000 [Bacteroidales bacterium]|nr:hypothetical protein [Bacteroidales bacterium]